MKKVLISLIGHQTLPLLLVIKQLQPDKVILLSSNKPDVKVRKEHLKQLLDPQMVIANPPVVDPWNIEDVPKRLQAFVEKEELQDAELICDVTGGTKAMSIGLAHFAEQHGHELIYLESDNGDPVLQRYARNEDAIVRIDAPEPITSKVCIDDFLFVYLGKFDTSPHPPRNPNDKGALFEVAVREGFERTGLLDEIRFAIKPSKAEEIDIVLRRGNRFAIVECKQGDEAGKAYGILQLNNLGSERYLGIYTRKILAVAIEYREKSSNNAAMADEHHVYLLELPDWKPERAWTEAEMECFRTAVQTVFGN